VKGEKKEEGKEGKKWGGRRGRKNGKKEKRKGRFQVTSRLNKSKNQRIHTQSIGTATSVGSPSGTNKKNATGPKRKLSNETHRQQAAVPAQHPQMAT